MGTPHSHTEIRGIGRGEFERKILPHYRRLHSFALSLTENGDDADDLTQETFLKALRFWELFEPGTNVAGWLSVIMRNTYINEYRKRARNPRVSDIDAREGTEDETRNLERIIASPDDTHRDLIGDTVFRALDALPVEFRTAIILYDIEGHDYEEIAETLGCPLGTVRSRLHRGRELLRLELGGYAERRGYDTAVTIPFLREKEEKPVT